jgi:ferredoxin
MNRMEFLERKTIFKQNIKAWLQNIMREYQLHAPTRADGVNAVSFESIGDAEQICLDYENTLLPAKVLFFPQAEEILAYSREGRSIQLMSKPMPLEERVLFGIRPCDARSLSLFDMVFGGDFPDSSYFERREKTVLIGIGCHEPFHGCFCATFDIDQISGEGVDILLVDDGDFYTVEEVNTKEGRRLLELGSGVFRTGIAPENRSPVVRSERLDITGITEEIGTAASSDFWKDWSVPCVECGICTYLCPTCHCFDVEDEELRGSGTRVRSWDYCMRRDFVTMASGENPRPLKGDRFRHRFMHKFSYIPKDHGSFGCVGCGRCITQCPVGIDVREILTAVCGKIRS